MKETLEFLAALQDVDSKLNYLESSKGDLPRAVESLRGELEVIDQTINDANESIAKSESEKKETDNLVSMAKEKLKKYQDQLYDVTSNKEYDAITLEIEMKKKEIDEGETAILEFEQSVEDLGGSIKEQDEEKKQLSSELANKEKELKSVLKATEERETKLKHQREKLLVRLTPAVLKRYERISSAKKGLAVVPVSRDACGGCFKTIPPQKIVEIEKLKQIIQCEVCGRILIPESKLSVVASL